MPAAAPNSAKVAAAPAQDDKLSPLTVTPVEHEARKDDPTSASGVQEDTAVLRSSDTVGVAQREDATVGAGHDELDELPPPPPQRPRSRGHRHYGLPFHGHIGPFRF
jgi:hypothetical protein